MKAVVTDLGEIMHCALWLISIPSLLTVLGVVIHVPNGVFSVSLGEVGCS